MIKTPSVPIPVSMGVGTIRLTAPFQMNGAIFHGGSDEETVAPVSYTADDALMLDPQQMVTGQRYPVRLGNQEWWAIKRDADRIDFIRK